MTKGTQNVPQQNDKYGRNNRKSSQNSDNRNFSSDRSGSSGKYVRRMQMENPVDDKCRSVDEGYDQSSVYSNESGRVGNQTGSNNLLSLNSMGTSV